MDGEEVEGAGESVGSKQNGIEQSDRQPTPTWPAPVALAEGEDKASHCDNSPNHHSPSPNPVSDLKDYLTHIPEMNLPWQSLRSVKTCSCGRAFTILVSKVSAPHTHTHTHTHARAHTRTHTRTHARAHTHTHTRTHTHTHTHMHTSSTHLPLSLPPSQYHCSYCGTVFCDACASSHLPLPWHATPRPHRVCRSCHKLMRRRMDMEQSQNS